MDGGTCGLSVAGECRECEGSAALLAFQFTVLQTHSHEDQTMPRRVAQNVSLTPEHAAYIAAQIASGRYGGVSEVVRAALEALVRHEAPRPVQSRAGVDASPI